LNNPIIADNLVNLSFYKRKRDNSTNSHATSNSNTTGVNIRPVVGKKDMPNGNVSTRTAPSSSSEKTRKASARNGRTFT
jgi:hypothetical protein